MEYSPKLKKAMEEIKAIYKKYDIAGVTVLHTPGFGEYTLHLTPSYSGAKLEGGNVRIQIKAEHFAGDTKKRDKCIEDTSNMLRTLLDITSNLAMNLMHVSNTLDKQVDAEHYGPGHTSSQEQLDN